jgi:hypothetical protein
MAKVSQRQVLATIDPVTTGAPKWNLFRFAQVSGGEITASVEKIYTGGSAFPTVLCAPYEIGDITLTAHYDDDNVFSETGTGIGRKLQDLRSMVGKAYYNITIATYDCDLKLNGNDRLYNNALLVGLTEPDGDSSSGAPATFAMTFSIQNVDVPSRTGVTA